MKFKNGDEIDLALATVLAHEFFLCKESFEYCETFFKKNIMGHRSKSIKIKCHNAYSRFLHHLYEFYVGCFKREINDMKKIKHDLLDKLFNNEVKKLLRNKEHSIKNNYAPSWENHVSVYQVSVPEDFGTQFRKIRNRTAHVDIQRSEPTLSLARFYDTYHSFIYLLYESAQAWWEIKNIEEFDLAIQNK
jgi:hypothetical protein